MKGIRVIELSLYKFKGRPCELGAWTQFIFKMSDERGEK